MVPIPHILRWALLLALLTSLPALAQQRGVTVELKAREDRRAPVVARVELYPRSHALVIGNDDYRDPFWARLSNGVRDARAVAAALEAKGLEVTLATDLEGDALEEALETFFFERGQDFEARLFVWYAGHGHTESGEGYLVPVDAPDPAESAGFRRTALSLRRMGEYARGANAHHVLAVFDSCFAGTVFEVQRNAPPAAITHATTRPVRQFITSGDAGQTVSDDGTFRRIFIEAIGGERRADLNADGYVTASELGLFLADSITNYSNGAQTPRYGKLRDPNWDQGDFVFSLAALPLSTQADDTAQQSSDIDPCTQVWHGIANSRRAADFELFLTSYPDCPMAPFARARLEALEAETKVAARTPPSEPAIAVEERDETLVTLKNANVRGKPVTDGEKLRTLRRGTKVAVTGRVKDRDWLRIALADGETGYIWAPLLGDRLEEPAPEKKPDTKLAVGTYPQRQGSSGPQVGSSFRDCAECPEMVVLPAGSFMMGSPDSEPGRLDHEGPRRLVTIPTPFAVGRYEVTRGEFAAFVSANGHKSDGGCHVYTGGEWKKQTDKDWSDPGFSQTDRDPVTCVNWNDAKAYVAWLSQRTRQY